jgi:hypothetical protein
MLTLAATLAAINPGVRLKHEENQRQFTVEIGPVDLPGTGSGHVHHGGSGQHAHTNAVTPPVSEVRIPIEGFVNGFRVSIADSAGKPVPSDLIHHLNFIDPENRELFLPISQRMLAVGKETGSHSFPRMLFGYPVRKAQPMIVSAMLHNPHAEDFSGVTVRVTFTYTPTRRLWPLFRVYPFQLDVLFPHGDKSFDLPPGRSERSFDASPVIPGRIVVMSGHVHEYAESLTMSDVTTGTVIWVGRPKLDTNGKVSGMPVANFASRLGVKLRPDHRYRVTVVYNNPTLDTLVAGGMGVVGGLFMPQLTARWPKADPTDTAYGIDRTHYLQLTRGVR